MVMPKGSVMRTRFIEDYFMAETFKTSLEQKKYSSITKRTVFKELGD